MAVGDEPSRDSGVPGSVPTVADVGERDVIARLTAVAATARDGDAPRGAATTVIGPGDDAAVLDVAPLIVVSTDTLVQDRHFRIDWSTPADIGSRAGIQAAADIAAMGARPVALVVSIGCPLDTPVETVVELDRGLAAVGVAMGAPVVGGDLVSCDPITVTVTVIGSTLGRSPIRLDGARPGNVVAVSGGLGGSAAGLAVLTAGYTGHTEVVAAHRVPSVDLAAGVVASECGATAMTDISDGLVDELLTMATAAGVRIDVRSDQLPIAHGVRAAAESVGADATRWALHGGEDHHLLASFEASAPAGWVEVGRVETAGADGPDVYVDGVVAHREGWTAF